MALEEQKEPVPLIDVPDTQEFRELEQNVAERKVQREQRERELSVIDGQYLLQDEEYDRERVEAEIAVHGQVIGEQFYHIGRKLLLLKEHEGHGYFLKALDRLGLNRRTAQTWMRCVVVAGKTKSATVAHLGVRKLIELGMLDDAELEALGEGQTVAGLVLDDLDKMSYSELKTQVRGHKAELKAQAESYDEVFERKDKALNERDREILRLQRELANPSAKELENRRVGALDKKLLDMLGKSHEAERALRDYRRMMDELCAIEGITLDELTQQQDEIRLHLQGVSGELETCGQFVPLLAPEAE